MDIKEKTLAHSIIKMQLRQKNAALKFKKDGQWQELSWSNYYKRITQFGSALISFGIQPGDRIAIMANTRYEWAISDLAIIGIKAITVPIYHNSTPEDVEFILNNAEVKMLICEGKSTTKTWNLISQNCPTVKKIISFEKSACEGEIQHWDEIVKIGESYLSKHPRDFQSRCESITPETIASILYTSGTTGKPKGVVISHTQIVSEVAEAFYLFNVGEEDLSLSFLPYAHILGRVELWGHVYTGYTIAFAESIDRLKHNLLEVKPTVIIAVPRIFEKIYSAIWSQVETQKLKLKLFNWAVHIGKQVGHFKMTHQSIPLSLLAQYEVAKKLVLGKITDAFGGRLRFAISGGAPLAKEIAEFFHAADLLVLEGYGLTETTAAITINTPFNYKFGTVGRPIGDVKIKIAEDGEILIKSHKVMVEYYRNPEATAEVMKDGWFCTGDIGELSPNGELRITDRKKDLIKTAGGKYVAPQRIENLLKLTPMIGHVLVHGDQKKFIVALMTLDRLLLEQYAKENQISFSHWTELVEHPQVQDVVRKAVADANAHLASFESIKKYQILACEFSVESGELTPSLKVKRKHLDKKFAKEISDLYH